MRGGMRSTIGRILKWFASKIGYRLVHPGELERRDQALAAASRVAASGALQRATGAGGGLRAIVFSRDRPLQLHALLGGLFDRFDSPPPIKVLFSVSNARAETGYAQVAESFPGRNLELIHETDFRADLLRQLELAGDDRLFFLVDDIVFIEPVHTADLQTFPIESHILSLRLAPRITYSYTRGQNETPPPLSPTEALEWNWSAGEIDWGYAFSVDGHIFSAAEILELARAVPFRAPNSFESNMQVYAPYFSARKGLCYQRPSLVNIPCNRVQTEIENTHGELHQDQLLDYWEAGQRVDFQKLYGFETNSCHQEIPLPLYSPTGGGFKT